VLAFGRRPRELRWYHAGPMLFGDWGTSRLYVLGIAWAASGHGSFVYVAAMCALLLVVAWAYTVICRLHPQGGGVYTAARERSPLLGVVGGLLLFADYVVTAAISALSAFQYLGLAHPETWAMATILGLGTVHFFGPKKAGVLALVVAVAAFVGYAVIAAFAAPSLVHAHVEVPRDTLGGHWTQFVHIVLALSGVEAIANMTGIMVEPVQRTSRLAIWPVTVEVIVLNLLLALAMHAVPPSVVDGRMEDMLRALSEHYVGRGFAAGASIVFALLLVSASSTAVTDMLGVQFAMARDAELPRGLARLNRFGVPVRALLLAVLAPILVLALEHDLERLAALYAIGVVGAIALNCYATATGPKPPGSRERAGLLAVSGVMAAVWLTVAWQKRQALVFASIVVGTGLLARLAFRRYREVARPVERAPFPADAPRLFVATRGDTFVIERGVARAAELGASVVVGLIREASFILDRAEDQQPDPALDPEAVRVFEFARKEAQRRDLPLRTLYAISTTPMYLIADHAVTLGVAEVHVGGSRRSRLEKVLRGNPLEELRSLLPEEMTMVVHRPPQT
jgi:amino acid transporter